MLYFVLKIPLILLEILLKKLKKCVIKKIVNLLFQSLHFDKEIPMLKITNHVSHGLC